MSLNELTTFRNPQNPSLSICVSNITGHIATFDQININATGSTGSNFGDIYASTITLSTGVLGSVVSNFTNSLITNALIGSLTGTSSISVPNLKITNNFQMTSGATAGLVLTSDATGFGTWRDPTQTTPQFVFATKVGTGTNSNSGVMLGYGTTYVITPVNNGRLFATIYGSMGNATGSNGASASMVIGTGTHPNYGVGQPVGSTLLNTNPIKITSGNNLGYVVPFSISACITGCVLNQPLWFDLQLSTTSASFTANTDYTYFTCQEF